MTQLCKLLNIRIPDFEQPMVLLRSVHTALSEPDLNIIIKDDCLVPKDSKKTINCLSDIEIVKKVEKLKGEKSEDHYSEVNNINAAGHNSHGKFEVKDEKVIVGDKKCIMGNETLAVTKETVAKRSEITANTKYKNTAVNSETVSVGTETTADVSYKNSSLNSETVAVNSENTTTANMNHENSVVNSETFTSVNRETLTVASASVVKDNFVQVQKGTVDKNEVPSGYIDNGDSVEDLERTSLNSSQVEVINTDSVGGFENACIGESEQSISAGDSTCGETSQMLNASLENGLETMLVEKHKTVFDNKTETPCKKLKMLDANTSDNHSSTFLSKNDSMS